VRLQALGEAVGERAGGCGQGVGAGRMQSGCEVLWGVWQALTTPQPKKATRPQVGVGRVAVVGLTLGGAQLATGAGGQGGILRPRPGMVPAPPSPSHLARTTRARPGAGCRS
jgi:hypothetical protein